MVATQPLPTLLSRSSCPPLHSRIAELKNRLLSDSDDDASEHKTPSKGTVLQLEERDLEAMTQHLAHERQVWLKLSLAAIRSAKSMEIASNDKLHALLHRWMEIRLLLTIETLRRDAHAYSRAHQPTTTANGAPIRSILALEHFPRPAIKPTPSGLKGSKKVTRSRSTDRHAAVPSTTSAVTSSSSLHKRPPHTAWEGTVYRHKLLTSLHYKLSLKLILQALQLHAQQAKQRRRMLTSIPTLRQQKLLQVTFLALVQYMVEARYLQHRSDVQATQFLLQRHVQTPFRLWHRRVHEQLPQWRRLQYAALTYRRYRRLQLAWKVLLVRLMRRRRMRQWQVTYRDRSRQLRAWLAWRWVWQQKDHWRSSLYARYTGTGQPASLAGGRGGSEAAQGQLSVQAVVARYRDRQRQWRQPAYAGIHQFPVRAIATTRSSDSRRSDSHSSRNRSRVAGDASVSLPPSRWEDEDEDNDVASRRSVFDSAKRSRFARSDSSVHLSHPSRQMTEPRVASSRTDPPSLLLRIDASSSRVTGRSNRSHCYNQRRNRSGCGSGSVSGSGSGSDDVSDDSLVEPDASSAGTCGLSLSLSLSLCLSPPLTTSLLLLCCRFPFDALTADPGDGEVTTCHPFHFLPAGITCRSSQRRRRRRRWWRWCLVATVGIVVSPSGLLRVGRFDGGLLVAPFATDRRCFIADVAGRADAAAVASAVASAVAAAAVAVAAGATTTDGITRPYPRR